MTYGSPDADNGHKTEHKLRLPSQYSPTYSTMSASLQTNATVDCNKPLQPQTRNLCISNKYYKLPTSLAINRRRNTCECVYL